MDAMKGRRFSLGWSIAMAIALAMAHLVSTTDHIVGGNRGWNANINYTGWVNSQTFYVGDWISFRYQKSQYDVIQVNESGYANCTEDNAIGNWSSGKDFLFLNESKRYYYICGRGQCYGGMKITFMVHELPPPPRASENTTSALRDSANGAGFGFLRPSALLISAIVLLCAGALLVGV